MESNLRSRVAEFEAGYFLLFVFFFFFCKLALSLFFFLFSFFSFFLFPVGFLKSGGWCLASFVEYGWSVRFVILFPGVVSGERKGLYYSVSCCGVTEYCGMMSGACVGSFLVGATTSCAVAGCVGCFLVGATASCAVAGCAPGAQRSRSGFGC